MEVAADSRFATFQASGRQMGEIDHRKKEEIVKRLLLFHFSVLSFTISKVHGYATGIEEQELPNSLLFLPASTIPEYFARASLV